MKSIVEGVIFTLCSFVGLLLAWSCIRGKKKDDHKKEYRDEDPIPFDEIP